jgi:glutamate N-acetyltransferase/amino-acid N-acetyltransferase
MQAKIEIIPEGCITSPRGFFAGATYAGIKKKAEDSLDLGVIFSEAPCVAAGLFTSNRIKAAPVILCQQRLKSEKAAAVVVNSGCANACTGERGPADAEEMANLAARAIGVSADDVLVASTGVIGEPLPLKLIRDAMSRIALSPDGGHDVARAIMTTDTRPKETAVAVKAGESEFIIGGVAKGSGMLHPNLATMLCFLTTDAAVDIDFLKASLRKAIDKSLNMVSVDGDSSTNDTVLIMANGKAKGEVISNDSEMARVFQQALDRVCVYLARCLARDGEGATKLIEVTVSGASSESDARLAARTVVSSPLVKTAIYGNDPNWGRIIAAAGRSGAEVVEANIDLYIGGIGVLEKGKPLPLSRQKIVRILKKSEVTISLNLNLGTAEATAWGCDLTENYVVINSQYTT